LAYTKEAKKIMAKKYKEKKDVSQIGKEVVPPAPETVTDIGRKTEPPKPEQPEGKEKMFGDTPPPSGIPRRRNKLPRGCVVVNPAKAKVAVVGFVARPDAKPVGYLADELLLIYRRKDASPLLNASGWRKHGYKIKKGESPLLVGTPKRTTGDYYADWQVEKIKAGMTSAESYNSILLHSGDSVNPFGKANSMIGIAAPAPARKSSRVNLPTCRAVWGTRKSRR
jgi:hypothetical protein